MTIAALTMTLRFSRRPDDGAVSVDELCRQIGVGKGGIINGLRELEAAGFIVNETPGRPPLKSKWRITCFPYADRPATKDYEKPEAVERLRAYRAGKMARRAARVARNGR
jgi:hypothetical protein